MRNLAYSLFEHERVRTTLPKAKEVRPFVDKIITLAKRGGLEARRQAVALMGNKVTIKGGKKVDVIGKLFSEAPNRFKSAGGYTRIVRLNRRPGDAAEMAYLEFVGASLKPVKKKAAAESAEEKKEASAS